MQGNWNKLIQNLKPCHKSFIEHITVVMCILQLQVKEDAIWEKEEIQAIQFGELLWTSGNLINAHFNNINDNKDTG